MGGAIGILSGNCSPHLSGIRGGDIESSSAHNGSERDRYSEGDHGRE